MNRRLTRQVAVGAATAVLAAGGGVAYAASSDSGADEVQRPHIEGQSFFSYGGDGPAPPPLGERGDPGERRHHVFGFAGPGAPLEGAADYLGLTEDELREQLEDGRTLAEIARAEGRPVEGLKDALLDAARERLDEAVEDGPLTEEQRDELLRGLESRIDDLIAGRLPRFGDGPRFHRFGGECAPGERPDGGRAERGSSERAEPYPGPRGGSSDHVAPDPGEDEQPPRGSTVPGSWDGAASGAVTA